MPRTFVMAGGGTGGHVIPALAVARELRARGHRCASSGRERGMEAKLVPADEFSHRVDRDRRLESRGLPADAGDAGELPFSVWQAARMLDRAAPAAVFSTGGYVAGPVLLAALWKRIPIVVMEPNAIPGFTHRHLARFVARALVSFAEAERWFPEGPRRSHGPADARRIFRGPAEAARRGDHGADHRRQPGLANA